MAFKGGFTLEPDGSSSTGFRLQPWRHRSAPAPDSRQWRHGHPGKISQKQSLEEISGSSVKPPLRWFYIRAGKSFRRRFRLLFGAGSGHMTSMLLQKREPDSGAGSIFRLKCKTTLRSKFSFKLSFVRRKFGKWEPNVKMLLYLRKHRFLKNSALFIKKTLRISTKG